METSVSEARWILVPLFCFYVVVMAAGIFLTWSQQQNEMVSNGDPRMALVE